jgi:3alpha(or 20beta)-hydroxysteroid dehydrogenase
MAPWTPSAGGARVDSGIEAKDADVAVIRWARRGLATGWVSELVHEGEFHAPARRALTVRDAWAHQGRPLELGRDNIRVNSVHPGRVPTPIEDEGPADVALSSARLVANPTEVTRLVLFLASSDASFSTGSEFLIDGGLLLGRALPRGAVVAAAA